MSRLKSFVFAGFLLATGVSLHAFEVANSTNVVPIERMQQVYEEVKTPFKYGVVIHREANELIDSPSVFRACPRGRSTIGAGPRSSRVVNTRLADVI